MADDILQRIVRIEAEFEGNTPADKPKVKVGSGFLINPSRILTVQHLVEKVHTDDQRERATAVWINRRKGDDQSGWKATIEWLGEKDLHPKEPEALDVAVLSIDATCMSVQSGYPVAPFLSGRVECLATGFSDKSRVYKRLGRSDWRDGWIQPSEQEELKLLIDLGEVNEQAKTFWRGVSGGPIFVDSQSGPYSNYLYALNRGGLGPSEKRPKRDGEQELFVAISIPALNQRVEFREALGDEPRRQIHSELLDSCKSILEADGQRLARVMSRRRPAWLAGFNEGGVDGLLTAMHADGGVQDFCEVLRSLDHEAQSLSGREQLKEAALHLIGVAASKELMLDEKVQRLSPVHFKILQLSEDVAEVLFSFEEGRKSFFSQTEEMRSKRRLEVKKDLQVTTSDLEAGLGTNRRSHDQLDLILEDIVTQDLARHVLSDDKIRRMSIGSQAEQLKAKAEAINFDLERRAGERERLYLLISPGDRTRFALILDRLLSQLRVLLPNLVYVELEGDLSEANLLDKKLSPFWSTLKFK